jgi:serine protease
MSSIALRVRALAGLLLALVFTTGAWASGPAEPDVKRYMIEFHVYGPQALQAIEARGGRVALELPNYRVAAAYLPESAVQALARHPNVREIAEDVKRFPMGQTVPYGIKMVQADQVSDENAANRKVCIIDSGYWRDHEDLSAGDNVTPGPDRGSGHPFTDGCGHGTHVAGTIAALDNSVGVVGVLPNVLPNKKVNLHIVKVFNDSCRWTYSSGLIQALEDCRTADANVVNMSLGGGKPIGPWEENAFNNAYAAGVLSVASAGNAGNNQKSYPASHDSVISVAAIDENKVVASFSQQNDQVELAAPGVAVLSTVPWLEDNSLTVDGVTYQGNWIQNAARSKGVTAQLADGGLCGSTGPWNNKVVLCKRGTHSFYDKVRNVQNSGGAAAVIYNNEPGNFFGTLGDGNSSDIPAISLSQEDGKYLVENKLASNGTVVSQFKANASGYEAWNGTSMAAPHVSGVAALVWSYNQSWTNDEIRQALRESAQDLGPAGRDNAYGYGLVQAAAALAYLEGDTTDPEPEPEPEPGAGTMSVAAIDAGVRTRGPWQNGIVTVTIHDDAGNLVSNATVFGTFTSLSDGVSGSVSGTTDANGSVTLESNRARTSTLSYEFCVTGVTHGALDYNADGNAVTCASP